MRLRGQILELKADSIYFFSRSGCPFCPLILERIKSIIEINKISVKIMILNSEEEIIEILGYKPMVYPTIILPIFKRIYLTMEGNLDSNLLEEILTKYL